MKFLEYCNEENKNTWVLRLQQDLSVVTWFKLLNRVNVPEIGDANIIIICNVGIISKSGAIQTSCLSSSTLKEGLQPKPNYQGKERERALHTLRFALKAEFMTSNYGNHNNNSKQSTQTEFWCRSVLIITYSVCQSSASMLFPTMFNTGTGQTTSFVRESQTGEGGWRLDLLFYSEACSASQVVNQKVSHLSFHLYDLFNSPLALKTFIAHEVL